MPSLITIKPSHETDCDFILQYDKHIKRELLVKKISIGEVYTIRNGNIPCGFMRYSLFWDNTPFLNMFYLLEEYRGKGFGKLALGSWERKMQIDGYTRVMTSTLANETAQFVYRNSGYMDCGALKLKDDPSLEIIFVKNI